MPGLSRGETPATRPRARRDTPGARTPPPPPPPPLLLPPRPPPPPAAPAAAAAPPTTSGKLGRRRARLTSALFGSFRHAPSPLSPLLSGDSAFGKHRLPSPSPTPFSLSLRQTSARSVTLLPPTARPASASPPERYLSSENIGYFRRDVFTLPPGWRRARKRSGISVTPHPAAPRRCRPERPLAGRARLIGRGELPPPVGPRCRQRRVSLARPGRAAPRRGSRLSRWDPTGRERQADSSCSKTRGQGKNTDPQVPLKPASLNASAADGSQKEGSCPKSLKTWIRRK
ncbi:uncharacterized protein LOC141919128 [Strix aluco]|uniref:uncharacterized protein LOC141919128 n=1 Tax=Strix aluco TaxID=111821 RepID=UPI003DA1C989